MPCHIITTWGEPLEVIDKTYVQVRQSASANQPFEVVTSSYPGPDAKMWIRAGSVAAVVNSANEATT